MNFHRHTLALAMLCTAGVLRMKADTQAEPAPSAHDDPVSLEYLVVSASPLGSSQIDLSQASTVLSGLKLQLARQATLGETLAAEPGMSSTYFGPGASRPIIRGQGGDRLKLLENGTGTLDASSVSPDHAVSIEPFLVRRIEIVRGPAALLYGSSAVGGVVNVLTHRIDDEAPTGRADTELMTSFDSAANSWARGGTTNIAVMRDAEKSRALVLHLDGFKRDAGDLRIPGQAEQEAPANIAGETKEPEGILPNSGLTAQGAAVGLSYIGQELHLGASYSGYNTVYGIPGHAEADEQSTPAAPDNAASTKSGGVHIALHQRRVDMQGDYTHEWGIFTGARFKFGHADYVHDEIEADGALGTRFTNRGYDARLEAMHGGADGRLAGSLGVQADRSLFSAIGEEAFVPSSLTRNEAVFAFEEYKMGRLNLQVGARLEHQQIEAKDIAVHRSDTLAGISGGLVWKLADGWTLTSNLSHSSRAPNAQELYADGPHAGTNSYELGSKDLRKESVSHIEVGIRRKAQWVSTELRLFRQEFSNHIHELRTGKTAIETPEGTQFVPDNSASSASGLPVYEQTQSRAQFTGLEFENRFHLHKGEQHTFDLRIAGDLVRAETDAGPLPRIPAARTTLGMEWRHGAWTASADWQHGFAQNQVAQNEQASPSYELAGASLTRCLQLGHCEADLFVRGSNLLNKEIRPHTSYLRDLAPLPGRAVSTGLTLRF